MKKEICKLDYVHGHDFHNYQRHRCRCEVCKQARRDYDSKRKSGEIAPRTKVPKDLAYDNLIFLKKRGYSASKMAKTLKVSPHVILRLLGEESTEVTQEIETKILQGVCELLESERDARMRAQREQALRDALERRSGMPVPSAFR